MCNYSVLLPCSVWAFAKDVVFREASKAHSLKGAELQAMSAKQYTLRCFLRATFAKHCILRRVLQAASAKHTPLRWLSPVLQWLWADGFPRFAFCSSVGQLA